MMTYNEDMRYTVWVKAEFITDKPADAVRHIMFYASEADEMTSVTFRIDELVDGPDPVAIKEHEVEAARSLIAEIEETKSIADHFREEAGLDAPTDPWPEKYDERANGGLGR
jgi:hypothetical protein